MIKFDNEIRALASQILLWHTTHKTSSTYNIQKNFSFCLLLLPFVVLAYFYLLYSFYFIVVLLKLIIMSNRLNVLLTICCYIF